MNGTRTSIGLRPELTKLSQLRAEAEPWLASCYVPPADFSLIAAGRSALIFGENGSGKTAMRLELSRIWGRSEGAANYLVVDWPINALANHQMRLTGSPLSVTQHLQVYHAIACTVLRTLAEDSELWSEMPNWVQITLGWFVRRFLQEDLATHIASLTDDGTLASSANLRTLLSANSPDLMSSDAPPVLVVGKLLDALKRLGMGGIRVVVDNAESWWETEPERLGESLYAFLSTLSFFEHPDFAYTMFLPVELLPKLSHSSAVARRRVQVFRIQYSDRELVSIVERWLGAILERADFELANLGPAMALRNWFVGCGGASPRGWLEAVRPLLAAYLEQSHGLGPKRPLSIEECRRIQQLHPPSLWIDPDTGETTVGWRHIDGLSPGQLAILRLLLRRPSQLCTRRQLYMAYIEAYPESYADPDAKPAEYAGVLDSALWRLRALIEPDPDNPVLLETRKGQGVVLRSM